MICSAVSHRSNAASARARNRGSRMGSTFLLYHEAPLEQLHPPGMGDDVKAPIEYILPRDAQSAAGVDFGV